MHLDLRYLVIISNEFFHKRVTHDLVRVVPDEAHGTLVPHIDPAVNIDTKNRSVGSINELGILALLCDTSSNILPDAHHTNRVAMLITTGSSVKKDFNSNAILGNEGKLEVCRLLATHGFVQNGLHSAAVFFCNKFLHQVLANDFIHGITDQFSGTLVPDIYSTVRVDTEDGCVGSIDKLGILALLGQTS